MKLIGGIERPARSPTGCPASHTCGFTLLPAPSSFSVTQHSMPRSEEAEAFFFAVYRAIQEIPYGKVTSYGHIAKLVGTRKTSPFPRSRPSIPCIN